MYQIGELWDAKKLDVGDEHIASNTAMRLIEKIGAKPRMKNKGKPFSFARQMGNIMQFHAI